jgi:hypothetical protein
MRDAVNRALGGASIVPGDRDHAPRSERAYQRGESPLSEWKLALHEIELDDRA